MPKKKKAEKRKIDKRKTDWIPQTIPLCVAIIGTVVVFIMGGPVAGAAVGALLLGGASGISGMAKRKHRANEEDE